MIDVKIWKERNVFELIQRHNVNNCISEKRIQPPSKDTYVCNYASFIPMRQDGSINVILD